MNPYAIIDYTDLAVLPNVASETTMALVPSETRSVQRFRHAEGVPARISAFESGADARSCRKHSGPLTGVTRGSG